MLDASETHIMNTSAMHRGWRDQCRDRMSR